MPRPQAKGWCPSTLRPMESGDGLIVRIKPPFGQLTQDQARQIAQAALQFGNGFIDVTSRANLQLRGITADTLLPLISHLEAAGLVNHSEAQDRLNIMFAPFAGSNDLGRRCGRLLYEAAAHLPILPAKFGFAIDCGNARYLTAASADIRIEATNTGQLLVRCDGSDTGFISDCEHLIDDIKEILAWYLDAQDPQSPPKRMARLLEAVPLPAKWQGHHPHKKKATLSLGARDDGFVIGVPFGQCEAQAFAQLAAHTKVIIMAPQRRLVIDGLPDDLTAFLTSDEDSRSQIETCPGKPSCTSATFDTRALASTIAQSGALSPDISLHISGCTKGCAAPAPRDICIIGDENHYAIIENGCAWDDPSLTSLSLDGIIETVRTK